MHPSGLDLQQLLDRAAIRDVLTRYFHAADSGDPKLLRSCFTDDVRARYDSRAPVTGVDQLMAQIPLFDNLATGACRICTHFMGSVRFGRLSADAADTETGVLAFLVMPHESADRVHMRSLRYLDRFTRVDDEWKIAVRAHTLDWSCEVPASSARTLAQRLPAVPDHLL